MRHGKHAARRSQVGRRTSRTTRECGLLSTCVNALWSFPLLVGLLHTVGQQVLQHRVGPERSSTDHRVGLLPGNDQELALKDLAQITKLAYCRETTRSWPESSKNSEGRSPPTPPEVQFLLVCGAGTPPVAVTSVLAWRCECGTGGVRVGAGPKT